MSDNGIVEYKATDGSDITLSPSIVQKYVVTGNAQADDKDVIRFMAQCKARGLNPLAGDAYMTTFRNREGGTTSSTIVSKDYFLRTAARVDSFDGLKAGVVVSNKKNGELTYREGSIVGVNTETLVGGWAEVHDKCRSVPSRAEVSMVEYDQHRSLWKSKPATMIRKVAISQALREMYPGDFGGIYDRDEMPEPEHEAPHEPLDVNATVDDSQETPETPQEPPQDEPEAPQEPQTEPETPHGQQSASKVRLFDAMKDEGGEVSADTLQGAMERAKDLFGGKELGELSDDEYELLALEFEGAKVTEEK